MADQAMTGNTQGQPMTAVPPAQAGIDQSFWAQPSPASSTPTLEQEQAMMQQGQQGQGVGWWNQMPLAPPFLGFKELFNRMHPQAPAAMKAAGDRLWEALGSLFDDGRGGFHPAIQHYDFGQYLHDLAVVYAAKAGEPSVGTPNTTAVAKGTARGANVTPKAPQQPIGKSPGTRVQ